MLLLSAMVSAYALYARFTQTNARVAQAKIASKNNKATWHKVICHIERQTLLGPAPKAQKAASIRFFNDVLINDVGTTACPGGKT